MLSEHNSRTQSEPITPALQYNPWNDKGHGPRAHYGTVMANVLFVVVFGRFSSQFVSEDIEHENESPSTDINRTFNRLSITHNWCEAFAIIESITTYMMWYYRHHHHLLLLSSPLISKVYAYCFQQYYFYYYYY